MNKVIVSVLFTVEKDWLCVVVFYPVLFYKSVCLISLELLALLTHVFLKIYDNVASLRVGSEIYFILLRTRVGNFVRSASLT